MTPTPLTPGQVAEAAYGAWTLFTTEAGNWERVAAAVIAHHEAGREKDGTDWLNNAANESVLQIAQLTVKLRASEEAVRDAMDRLGASHVWATGVEQQCRTQAEYIELLQAELEEVIPFTAAHGWKSKRYEEGARLRAALAKFSPPAHIGGETVSAGTPTTLTGRAHTEDSGAGGSAPGSDL